MLMNGLGLTNLSVQQRRALESKLEEGLMEETGDEMVESTVLTDAMRAELQRRIEEDRLNPGQYLEWSVVKAQMREKYGV